MESSKDIDHHLRIPRLTNANFRAWQESMIRVFKTAQLWRVVTGDHAQPEEPKRTTTEAAFLAACEKDAHAALILTRSIPSTMVFKKDMSAKDMYDTICTRYGQEDPVHPQLLWQAWITIHWDGNSTSNNVTQFINNWTSALTNCQEAGFDIPDLIQATQFIVAVSAAGNGIQSWYNARRQFKHDNPPKLDTLIHELVGACKAINSQEENNLIRAVRNGDTKRCYCCAGRHTYYKCFHLNPHLAKDPQFKPNNQFIEKFKRDYPAKAKDLGINDHDNLPKGNAPAFMAM